jgi:hypothetical protein
VRQILTTARTAGVLPQDITFEDVGMMLVRIARPLPGPLSAEAKHDLARRHLELFIRGLGALTGRETTATAEARRAE